MPDVLQMCAILSLLRATYAVGCEKRFGLEPVEIQKYEKESLGYSRATYNTVVLPFYANVFHYILCQ